MLDNLLTGLFLASQSAYYLLQTDLSETSKLLLKPLPLIALICLISRISTPPSAKQAWGKMHQQLILGLIFSLGGDIALVFPSSLAFLAGLVLFAIAHVLYLFAFHTSTQLDKISKIPHTIPPLARIIVLSALALAPPTLVYRICYADPNGPATLGSDRILFVGVHVYALLLAAMAFAAYRFASRTGSMRALFGALLFVISDSILGLTVLAKIRIPFASLAIIATYWWAQWLIAYGLLAPWMGPTTISSKISSKSKAS
eukprot:TRINITY_DN20029_c0_g1_i1.p1 TRINITY_DN20029_c0_g1~~TRINITY_DN20029_c0_g1_i1.p1  ORF type:complete len:258 (-),score=54.00 TRINITY_DN20029_c0_g1_i1:67-840(-)